MEKTSINEKAVLQLIASTQSTSQKQIMEKLQAPKNTVHDIVERLLNKDLISFSKTERYGRGRPMKHYQLKSQKPILVLSMDGTQCNMAFFDNEKLMHEITYLSFNPFNNLNEIEGFLKHHIAVFLKKNKLNTQKLMGIVLSIVSIRTKRGKFDSASQIWSEYIGEEIFKKWFKCPVYLELSSSKLRSELKMHSTEVDTVVRFNIADGVSAYGESLDPRWGSIFKVPGRIGHVVLHKDGLRCHCGNRGCLEAYTSGLALLKKVSSELKKEKKTALKAKWNSPKELVDALELLYDQDAYVKNVVDQLIDDIAWGVALMVNIVKPGVIVLSGYVLEGREKWKKQIEKRSKQYIVSKGKEGIRLEFSQVKTECYLHDLATNFKMSVLLGP